SRSAQQRTSPSAFIQLHTPSRNSIATSSSTIGCRTHSGQDAPGEFPAAHELDAAITEAKQCVHLLTELGVIEAHTVTLGKIAAGALVLADALVQK
ncbi:MAG: hypothetical protein JRC58_00315, partial [Deltaproteobacteria bacterium]|nr:hypothetical protein [Deltaproteobacteria bacterium]